MSRGGGAGCRATYAVDGPLLDAYKRCTPCSAFLIVYCVAHGMSHQEAMRETGLPHATVCRWYRKVEACCLWESQNNFRRPTRIEALVIDETCFASRKYHRGHRVRESGPQWWFSVVVVGVRDGEVHRGNMYYVNNRTSATLLPIISSLKPERGYANITSDVREFIERQCGGAPRC